MDDFPPILVNVGDLLSHWTAGLLKSTIHRVVFPKDGGDDRYSIAYFCHPSNDTRLVTIPSSVISKKALKGYVEQSDQGTDEIMTAEEHLNSRLAATYGWGKQDFSASDSSERVLRGND